MFEGLMALVWPVLLGAGFYWAAGKCRGRNARNAFRYSAWGSWLLLLWFLPISIFPFPLGFLNVILSLTPSVICFLLAASSMLKEVRSQQRGDYTERAQ